MTEYLDTWSREREAGAVNGFWERIVRLLRFARNDKGEQTLVSGLDAAQLALMIDISHWQGDVDIARMAREGGIAACFPKMSDGKQVRAGSESEKTNFIDDWFYRNVQKCYDAKIPCVPYHYVQVALPDCTVQDLINGQWEVMQAALLPLAPRVSYHAICLDVEERNGSDTNARDVVLGLMAKIAAHPKMSQVPIIVYTSMSVLNLYPALRDQLSYPGADKNLWLAQWVYTAATTTTWERLKSEYIPRVEMKVLTPGFANWWAVQWSSAFVLPGGSGRTDLSFYRSTKAALWSWLGFAAAQPEEPEPPDEEEGNAECAEIAKTLARIEKVLGEVRGKFS